MLLGVVRASALMVVVCNILQKYAYLGHIEKIIARSVALCVGCGAFFSVLLIIVCVCCLWGVFGGLWFLFGGGMLFVHSSFCTIYRFDFICCL